MASIDVLILVDTSLSLWYPFASISCCFLGAILVLARLCIAITMSADILCNMYSPLCYSRSMPLSRKWSPFGCQWLGTTTLGSQQLATTSRRFGSISPILPYLIQLVLLPVFGQSSATVTGLPFYDKLLLHYQSVVSVRSFPDFRPSQMDCNLYQHYCLL
jgi:hypothetical protein